MVRNMIQKRRTIGGVEVGGEPKIVAVSGGDNLSNIVKNAERDGADILEIRVDLFKGISEESYNLNSIIQEFKELKRDTTLPILVTIRRTLENGLYYVFSGSEERRLKIFKAIMPYIHAVDIESDTHIKKELIDYARQHDVFVIESYHNFFETPEYDRLVDIVEGMLKDKPDVVKIATMALKQREIVTLNRVFVKYSERGELITIVPQGNKYSLFRVIFPMLSSCLTYGHVGVKNASGQLSVFEMKYMLTADEPVIPVPLRALSSLEIIE